MLKNEALICILIAHIYVYIHIYVYVYICTICVAHNQTPLPSLIPLFELFL